MLDIEKIDYHLGLVKWFGGHNYQNGRKNDFGFIKPMNGDDVFVHKNEIKSGIDLNENEIVIFEIGERNGRTFARNVHRPSREPKVVESLLKLYLKNKEKYSDFFDSSSLKSSFKSLLDDDFIQNSDENIFLDFLLNIFDNNYSFFFNKIDDYLSIKGELDSSIFETLLDNLEQIGYRQILQSDNKSIYLSNEKIREFISSTLAETPDQMNNNEISDLIYHGLLSYDDFLSNTSFIDFAYENEEDHKELFDLLRTQAKENIEVYQTIKETRNCNEIFRRIIGRKAIKTLLDDGISLSLLPTEYVKEQEESLYKYINNLQVDERNRLFSDNIELIPQNILFVSLISGILENQDQVLSYTQKIRSIIEKKFRDNTENLPDYVNLVLDSLFDNINEYLKNESIRIIIEPLLFKKSLYQKKPNVKQFFDNSVNLSISIEHFILANLFPLIQANNNIDTSYEVFLRRLWEALIKEQIDINDSDLFNLFPSCDTMGYNELSCEAFFWQNENQEDIFLCRGRPCRNPQVLPNNDKHYLDYNIYDWFKHFDIDYLNDGKPSKKDFPIKLAGYFNRLKEKFDVIKCRECDSLMLPDMRYARVEYYEYDAETEIYVKKNNSAAYRVTVFECRNHVCSEYKNKYYINHCLGFGCYDIIDSRDLKRKCDNGRYICRNCGSCCEQCAKINPNGFCPDCGSSLVLYEKYGRRFVYCSRRDCDFNISEKELPKKFLLTSAPVRKLSGD